MLLSKVIGVFGVLTLFVAAGTSAVSAGEIEARIFELGARWGGDDYALARDTLVRCGKEQLPFLEKKAKSKNWRERMLAEILGLRIQEPENIEKWSKALLDFDLKAANRYRGPDWDKLPSEPGNLPASYLADCLIEHADSCYDGLGEKVVTGVALQFYLAPSEELIPAILHVAWRYSCVQKLSVEGFVKLGKECLPSLRRTLQGEKLSWYATLEACVAAEVVSRLEDKESIPLLLKRLESVIGDKRVAGPFAKALSRLQAVSALDVMLKHLLPLADPWKKRKSFAYRDFTGFRKHIVGLGKGALPVLRKHLATADSNWKKIVLEHLIAEISGADAKTLEVAKLRESLWFRETVEGLVKLYQLAGEDIFERLRTLTHPKSRQRKAAYLAFGELKEQRAVALLLDLIKQQHTSLERAVAQRKTQKDAAPFDPQKAREEASAFGSFGNRVAGILLWGDIALLSLRRIGGEEAKKALTAAAAYPEYKARAETSLLMLEKKTDEIVQRLSSEDRAVREEAALALYEWQDARGAGELLHAAVRRQGQTHQEWKGRALTFKDKLQPVLEKLLKSDSVRERVLAETLLMEIKDPEKVKQYEAVLLSAVQWVGMKHVWHIADVKHAGKQLVAKEERKSAAEGQGKKESGARRVTRWRGVLDESHIPLLEASCMFGRGIFHRGIAAFALGEFKKPRSMQALVESFNMGCLGGTNPAAAALTKFGKEGAELAKKVPPPTPGEFDTGLHMTMHRGGVRVLSENKDIRGVEEILKGLKTLEQDKALDLWKHRARIYLGAAAKYHDKRLVEPLVRILETDSEPEKDLHWQVIRLLCVYADERVMPHILKRMRVPDLSKEEKNYSIFALAGVSEERAHDWARHAFATTALAKRFGAKTPDFLIEQFKKPKDKNFRAAILLALGQLCHSWLLPPPSPGQINRCRWSWTRFFMEKEERAAVAPFAEKTRKLAYPVLLEALGDASEKVSFYATLGLLTLAWGRDSWSDPIKPDPRAAKPLMEWCQKRGTCFYPLTEYLVNCGGEEAGPLLLGFLKRNGHHHLVDAVTKLKPRGAVPVIARRARDWYARRPDSDFTPRELDALMEFGQEGAKALLEIFRDIDNMWCKRLCAEHLAKLQHKPAAEPIAKLLRATIDAGEGNPKLLPKSDHVRKATYLGTCRDFLNVLSQLDAKTAKAIGEGILLNGPDGLLRTALRVWSADETSDK